MPNDALSLDQPASPNPVPDRNPIFFGSEGLRAGWSLFLYVGLIAAFFTVARLIIGHLRHGHPGAAGHEQSILSALLGDGLPLLFVALATGIMARIERRPVGAYGFGGTRRVPHFFAGLLCGVVFLSLLVLSLKSAGLLVFDLRLLSGATMLHYAFVWLGGFLLVALFEEYFLRGYLQFTLARGLSGIYEALHASHSRVLGFWSAALLLSFVFGLGHGSNAGESPIGLLSAGLAGLVFCLSLWQTGSLWWAIGFHTSWDWAQSFLYGVADSGTMVQHHLFATHPVGKPIFSGGATGPEGSLAVVPVLAVVAVFIVLSLKRRDTA